METDKISVIIGGEAGAGIDRSGLILGKTLMRSGFHIFGWRDYQSLIRGGHTFYVMRAEAEKVYSQPDKVELILALNKETALKHKDRLVPSGGIVYDGGSVTLDKDDLGGDDLELFPIPLRKLVKDVGGPSVMRNTVAIGGALALIDYDFGPLESVIKDTFRGEVARLNVEAARRGYDYAKKSYGGTFKFRLSTPTDPGEGRMLLSGNEAVGLGAISAGCKFYAAYPMTPATPLLHFMAANERRYGMIVIQVESEIAAINMVVGAFFGGVRAMTATSGGGFCLMSEGLGMAGMTETPAVIMMGQRPGPSTGLPTYSGQGDLRFVLHASQGEFPRIVIAPGDVEECFYLTAEAFNLAERYQMPVVLLMDKDLLESHESTEPFNLERVAVERGPLQTGEIYEGKEEYKRYKITGDGISPRVLPGTKGAIVRGNADEHDERGFTTEDPVLTSRMMEKRMRKIDTLNKDLEGMETIKLYGPERADLTLIGWGSTKGRIREAMKILSRGNVEVNYLQIVFLNPFPEIKARRVLESSKETMLVEHNKTSQLTSLIRENLLMDVDHKILKYDGRPFSPGELVEKIKEAL